MRFLGGAPIITVGMLQRASACDEQVNLFREKYPHGVALTLLNMEAAVAAGLNVEWLIDHSGAVLGDEFRGLGRSTYEAKHVVERVKISTMGFLSLRGSDRDPVYAAFEKAEQRAQFREYVNVVFAAASRIRQRNERAAAKARRLPKLKLAAKTKRARKVRRS